MNLVPLAQLEALTENRDLPRRNDQWASGGLWVVPSLVDKSVP